MKVKNMLDLTGKIALITGGSRGLGLQMAEALGEMGAKLVLTARSVEDLAQAKAQLEQDKIEALTISCDLTQPQAVVSLVDQVLKQYGKIDILMNNAGAIWREPAEEHSLEGWEKVMAMNLTGTFLVTREVGKRAMIPSKYGRVIVVASTQGLRGNRVGGSKTLAYNTSKGALLNFTRALCGEWGPYGITVNCIAPGLFKTKMTEKMFGTPAEKAVISVTPTGRLGKEDDMKGLAVLLSSDASQHISGQIIAVDGGMSAV